MSREKQIEEMFFDVVKAFNYARDFCTEQGGCDICEKRKYEKNCDFISVPEYLYNAGYRKASEVAEEIFGEIEATSSYSVDECNGRQIYSTKIYTISALKLAELKKKYTKGGDINVPTKESEDKNDS